jgi:Protein of unknown function (DUF3375)
VSKFLESAYKLREARQQATWRLLAADDAPSVMAILKSVSADGSRTLSSAEIHEQVRLHLEELRSDGEDLRQEPKDYISQWVLKGWLNRRLIGDNAQETYELSSAAQSAIRIMSDASSPRSMATESRLALMIQVAARLEAETNANAVGQIDYLRARFYEAQEALMRATNGQIQVLDDAQAAERLQDLVSQLQEITGDFTRLKEEFSHVDRAFRRKLIEGGESRSEILDRVFSSLEILEGTEAGKSFLAFWRLLTTPSQYEALENAIDGLLQREFAKNLTREQRRSLQRLQEGLMAGARNVHGTLHGLSRGLKAFVQSKEYREHQRMRTLLAGARQQALAANKVVSLTADINVELTLPEVEISSISQWSLKTAAEEFPGFSLDHAADPEISLEEIGRQMMAAEIDMATLVSNIKDALQKRPQVSIGELCTLYPVHQGLGSVIGYVHLGAQHAIEELPPRMEQVRWVDGSGSTRNAHIRAAYFTKEKQHELS